jgi:hypothetical protein
LTSLIVPEATSTTTKCQPQQSLANIINEHKCKYQL